MQQTLRQLALGGAFLAAAGLAHASVVIDFEAAGLANLYAPGESFTQSGFVMTQLDDFGIVGRNVDFVSGAPTGNSTQYYFNSNNGALAITSQNGTPFGLEGFSAAFVPQSPPVSQTIVLIAVGVPADGSDPFFLYFGLGSATNGRYPFLSFSAAADFAAFTKLSEVDFYGCVLTSSDVCNAPTRDNAQFALDNVRLAPAVPEPATVAMLALGLAGVAGGSLHRRRRTTVASR